MRTLQEVEIGQFQFALRKSSPSCRYPEIPVPNDCVEGSEQNGGRRACPFQEAEEPPRGIEQEVCFGCDSHARIDQEVPCQEAAVAFEGDAADVAQGRVVKTHFGRDSIDQPARLARLMKIVARAEGDCAELYCLPLCGTCLEQEFVQERVDSSVPAGGDELGLALLKRPSDEFSGGCLPIHEECLGGGNLRFEPALDPFPFLDS